MEIIGRITKDAVVSQLKDERTVVNFTVALNDYYKPRNAEVGKAFTTYVNCSYWLKSAIAKWLTKGTLVELSGRVGVNAYTNAQEESKAALTFHVNSLKLHGSPKGGHDAIPASEPQGSTVAPVNEITEPADDLPF